MKRHTLPAVFAIVLISSATVFAQSNQLRGKVRATNGVTVNNAIVELRVGGSGMIAHTVTRNDGDFAFNGLTNGEYEVAVTIAGYEPVVQTARFNQPGRMDFSEVINMEILIRPKPERVLSAPGTNFAQNVPKPARLAYEKAATLLRDGKADEAVAALREAIASFNDYFDAHFVLGKELFRAGKDNEALEALERARQINDRQYALYHIFGLIMMKQGKFTVAEYAFREATRLNGNHAASHFYRAEALINLAVLGNDERQRAADLSNAEDALDRAWETSGKRLTAVYLQRARIHEKRGEKSAAAANLESYLKAEPEVKNAAAIRATIEKLRGQNK